MGEEISINGIDVSECPCKDDDKCLEVPILNEYGDLIDYQDCEPQTLCPYRSKIKIQRLQEENEELKERFNELYNNAEQLANKYNKYGGNKENELVEIINKTTDKRNKYKQALEEIRDIAKEATNSNDCYVYMYAGRMYCEPILKKIEEVLGDNEDENTNTL